MAAFKSRIMEWDDDLQPIVKELSASEKLLIFITHNVSTFNSNNGRRRIWIYEDKSPLRKKVRNQELHVLDYLTPIGWLDNGKVCEILKCGGDI